MKLLVIEDDKKTASYLRRGLSQEGFAVKVSYDGEEGLRIATRSTFDLLILDILLPGRDGWWVLGELRRSGRRIPVLILSACGNVTDRVKGLRLGADDYLVKPFSFSELLARVKSILHRGQAGEDVLRISDLEIDVFQRRAKRQGARLDLTPKEFQLLSLLASRPNQVISRAVIADQVWDINSRDIDANLVDVHIRRLRSKVDEPFEKRLIHTVRGLGYVLKDQ